MSRFAGAKTVRTQVGADFADGDRKLQAAGTTRHAVPQAAAGVAPIVGAGSLQQA